MNEIEKSLLLAAFFRGGSPDDSPWTANSDQIVTLSLFYSGNITAEDCIERFATKGYISKLYDDDAELTAEIEMRYGMLQELLQMRPHLIEGRGNSENPADPQYTSCRLTKIGQKLERVPRDSSAKLGWLVE